jgi:hypothetical protein
MIDPLTGGVWLAKIHSFRSTVGSPDGARKEGVRLSKSGSERLTKKHAAELGFVMTLLARADPDTIRKVRELLEHVDGLGAGAYTPDTRDMESERSCSASRHQGTEAGHVWLSMRRSALTPGAKRIEIGTAHYLSSVSETSDPIALDISRALLIVGNALEALLKDVTGHFPRPAGSMAALVMSDPISEVRSWRGSSPRNVYEDVLFLTMAAVDHMRSMVTLLRRHQLPTASLASLTRGQLEAASRAFWILADPDPRTTLIRHAELAYHDVGDAINSGAKSTRYARAGNVLTPEQVRQEIVAYLNLLSAKPSQRVGAHTILLQLLEAIDVEQLTTDQERRDVYSSLSAVAHAQLFGVTSFIWAERNEDGTVSALSLQLPQDMLLEYTAYVHQAAQTLGARAVEYFAADRHTVDRWNAATNMATSIRTDVQART